MTKQEAYCQYLRNWANSHSGIGFEGMTPACFDEWECSERREIAGQLGTTYFLQINYEGQDADTHDTVALLLPDIVTEDDLYEAIQTLTAIYGDEKYGDEDMLDLTDEMLDELVSRWQGSWNYLTVFGVMEVNGYERKFSRI